MKKQITINYKGVELDVEYYFQPEEKSDMYYPGCGAEVEEILEIKHKDTCMYDLLESQFEEISDFILNELEQYRSVV